MERERLTKKEVLTELSSKGDESITSVKRSANNTFEVTYKDGVKAIRYHHTNVVSIQLNGDLILNSGGWMSSTTKERIASNLPAMWRLRQINKVWYITNNSNSWTFQDGMVLHSDGTVDGAGINSEELLKIDKKILRYVEGYSKALFDGKIKKPSRGDCWGCLLKDKKTGKPIMGTGHLFDHFKQKYYVPSLLIRAVEVFPVSQIGMHLMGYWLKFHSERCEGFDDVARHQIKSSLKRYLRRQLGLAA